MVFTQKKSTEMESIAQPQIPSPEVITVGENILNPEEFPKSEHLSEEPVFKGDFVSIEKFHFKDHNGIKKSWEVAARVVKPQPGTPDCVSSLAVLRRILKYDCLILVKQYRPALKSYTLEFPAGLVNDNTTEKTEETAIRELREETGYACSAIKYISPITAMDPGMSECTMKMVSLEVDGDVLENHFPKQCDQDFNTIEVIHIPVNELLTRLNDYNDQGVVVDSRVYCFAVGLTIGSKHVCYKPTANPY